jgi:hypothetical protein
MAKKTTAQASAEISNEVRQLIELTATTAAMRVYADGAGQVDHYRTTEKLLYNYKRLESLVRNEEEYLTIEHHAKSKSVVVFNPSGGAFKTEEDVMLEAAHERAISYARAVVNFREVERVIDLFRDRKEFIVIRMYYFREDADGNEREHSGARCTFEDIAIELSERDILKDEKTARRWRTNLISDIAVCMFGKAAAISTGAYRPKNG